MPAKQKRGHRNRKRDLQTIAESGALRGGAAAPLGEKALHRMLNRNGNPTARNLGVIVWSIAEDLGVKPRVAEWQTRQT